MPQKKPTHAQAQLQLQLYDLRREAKLRLAREWFFENYHAESLDEANRLTPLGSVESAYARMVTTYWEQACALLNYGLLHEELFFETSGEFFAVWEQVKSFLPELRSRYQNPHFFHHIEKAARRYEKWIGGRAPGWVEAMREYRRQTRATRANPKSR
jgi:hypothetical protein